MRWRPKPKPKHKASYRDDGWRQWFAWYPVYVDGGARLATENALLRLERKEKA